jgi:hypothetical protein
MLAIPVRLGIDCERLPRAAARARQSRSFVYGVRVQHRSAAAACDCWSTLFLSHKTVSTERTQHTEIPLPRDKKPIRVGSTRTKFARQCSSCRARQHGIDFARQSKEILPRASAARNQYPALNARLDTAVVYKCTLTNRILSHGRGNSATTFLFKTRRQMRMCV